MLCTASPQLASRRRFLAGLGLTAIGTSALGSASLAAAPVGDDDRRSYQARLESRLDDAGGGAFSLDFARGLLDETNRFRLANGLAPYAWDEELARSARAHAADMCDRRYFDHVSPEGFSHLDRVSLLTRELCGRTAENLVWRGNDPQRQTPTGFEALWENSDAHRRNLLQPRYTSAGYGVVKIGGRHYAAGVYSDAAVRLPKSVPLQLLSSNDLAACLEGCSPVVGSYAITRPFERATRAIATASEAPRLASGAWQLRPLIINGDRLDVLAGPTFFVG